LFSLAILGGIGFAGLAAIVILWVFLPEVLLVSGAIAAVKGSKVIAKKGFQRNTKVGLITTLAVISTVLPYLGGMEAHKALDYNRDAAIEELVNS
jgi:hypothetical protein